MKKNTEIIIKNVNVELVDGVMDESIFTNLDKDKIAVMKYDGLGIRSYIEELVQYIQVNHIPTYTLEKIYNYMLS